MIQDNTNDINKLMADELILVRDTLSLRLQEVNKILLNIVSDPEYENNKINIQMRELIPKSAVNPTLSAQDLINEVSK